MGSESLTVLEWTKGADCVWEAKHGPITFRITRTHKSKFSAYNGDEFYRATVLFTGNHPDKGREIYRGFDKRSPLKRAKSECEDAAMQIYYGIQRARSLGKQHSRQIAKEA